jgi:sec-independent protein translocase protein TatA
MLAFLFLPGGSEWLLIVAAIAIVFGATRIPQLMRGMGQGIKEFKQAVREEEPAAKPGPETAPPEPPANGDAAPKPQ